MSDVTVTIDKGVLELLKPLGIEISVKKLTPGTLVMARQADNTWVGGFITEVDEDDDDVLYLVYYYVENGDWADEWFTADEIRAV